MEPEIKSEKVDSLFSQKIDWGHTNGSATTDNKWEDSDPTSEQKSGKYVPEQYENRITYYRLLHLKFNIKLNYFINQNFLSRIDPAVISSIPTSSTAAEVTSYEPTNDTSRYIPSSAPSNQFPSSQQEGGLTSSLNENDFSSLAESLQNSANLASMPMISGITESHKLEQEQRNAKTTTTQPPMKMVPRKPFPQKSSVQSGAPVVMPRSAKHVHDVEEQFAGLEFGSGPVSPRLLKIANTSLTFTR